MSLTRINREESEKVRDIRLTEKAKDPEPTTCAGIGSALAAALDDRAFLLELLDITVKTGTKDPLLDARLAEARAALAQRWEGRGE